MSDLVCSGRSLTIWWAITATGRMPAAEFFAELSDADQTAMMARFRRLAEHGQMRDPRSFRKLEGTAFFEFKRDQVRMLCFFAGHGRLVLTHGFVKKRPKTPRVEIARAGRVMKEHLGR